MKKLSEFLEKLDVNEKVILLSIKPRYSRMIFSGEKTVELRKRFPRLPSKFVLVYETSPTKRIIGYFEVKKSHLKTIKSLEKYYRQAMVDKTFINEYFKGKDKGVAIEIKKVFEFEKKISLTQLKNELKIYPPQDFMYLGKEEIAALI